MATRVLAVKAARCGGDPLCAFAQSEDLRDADGDAAASRRTTWRQVKRRTIQPAAWSWASRARSDSNARRRPWTRQPSVSTITRCSGQWKSTSWPRTCSFTRGLGARRHRVRGAALARVRCAWARRGRRGCGRRGRGAGPRLGRGRLSRGGSCAIVWAGVVIGRPWWIVVSRWVGLVDLDAAALSWGAVGERDVDERRHRGDEGPDVGGGAVGDGGARAGGDEGGDDAAAVGDGGVADGVDASVDADESARGEPMLRSPRGSCRARGAARARRPPPAEWPAERPKRRVDAASAPTARRCASTAPKTSSGTGRTIESRRCGRTPATIPPPSPPNRPRAHT